MTQEKLNIDKYFLDMINDIDNTAGEGMQLQIAIKILENLLNWLGLYFDNEEEKRDYENIEKCKNNLLEIYLKWY